MTILISTATAAKQALTNNFGLSSSDPSNLIFGTAFDETFNFSGIGNLSVVDVSNGDVLILDSATVLNQNRLITVTNQGNDVVVSSVGTYTLGGLNSGETVSVSFSGADSLAISRVGNGFSYTTTITGGMGNDSLADHSIVGSAADDIITVNYYYSNGDTITGGAGNDTFNVNSSVTITDFTLGQDTLNISTNASADIYLPTTGGTFDYSTVTNNGWLYVYSDNGMAAVTITGSSGNDKIYGSTANDAISGGDGNDIILGNGGNDTLTGGAGNDYFDVSGGETLITDFSSGDYISNSSTAIVPITASADFSNSGGNSDSTLKISAATAPFAVTITGFFGVDSITGSAFSDSIGGGDGNDIITGSSGADTLDGGNNRDTYVIAATGQTGSAPTGWTALGVSMAGGSTIDTTGMDIISMPASQGDMLDLTAIAPTLTSVAAITTTIIDATSFIAAGTGTAAQSFIGSYANNTFTSDTNGEDTLLVYDNNGSADGGALEAVVLKGITTLTAYDGIITAPDSTTPDIYSVSFDGTNVSVQSNERGTAYLYPTGTTVSPISTTALTANISSTITVAPQLTAGTFDLVVKDIASNATTSTAKVILGTTGDDALTGTSGDDVISGFAGNDTISGSAGQNTMTGGTGNDVFNVEGVDIITDFTIGEDTLNISFDAGASILLTTGGTFDYSTVVNNGTLYVDGWNSSVAQTIIGSSGADSIYSSYVSGNVISTGNGNDTIWSNRDNAAISGGDGNDSIYSSGDNATLTGGAGSDYFEVYGTTTLITDFASAEGDRLYVEGVVTVPITTSTDFSNFNNYGTLKISAAAATAGVTITAPSGGAESITGSAFSDSIVGSAYGNDTITGGLGADTINGGSGNDFYHDTYVISATGETGIAPASWTANVLGTPPNIMTMPATIDVTNMDIITMSAGDKFDIAAIAATLTSVAATTTMIVDATTFTAAGTGTAAQSFKGSYSGNTFTSVATGVDMLLVYDNNGSASGGTLEAVVLVGTPELSVLNGVFTGVNNL